MSKTSSSLNFFDILILRSEWEDLVREYKIPNKNGTIDNLRWFVRHGAKGNRFRNNFDRAMIIARMILKAT